MIKDSPIDAVVILENLIKTLPKLLVPLFLESIVYLFGQFPVGLLGRILLPFQWRPITQI